MWVLILALITLTAVLSIWFSDRHTLAKKRYGGRHKIQEESGKLRKTIYARLCLDEFISKGIVSCIAHHISMNAHLGYLSAHVEPDFYAFPSSSAAQE